MTQLIEFKNHQGETLRGLFDNAQSDNGIVFVHGFERTTVESKFKNIVDKLKGELNLFRFDFSGCGLSDGRFEDMTVRKLTLELKSAIKVLRERRVKQISLVGHSLAGCVILEYLKNEKEAINKIVFLAPALNQKDLLRYWFVKSKMKKEGTEITWDNFKDYFEEDAFNEYVGIKKRMTAEHELLNDYFIQNKEKDFQKIFKQTDLNYKNILIIHGGLDDKVPLASNNELPSKIKILVVREGDHDLQRADIVNKYLNEIVDFIKN